ncbi:MAG: GIY-YIG nuclease family protein [Candidatus Eisenbacteria bacterium]|nr:GIY-YIG nuclease family protein [Candidatus Eisenbacteria bacterium]
MNEKREEKEDRSWSVYIVECADGTLYTGIARSVRARVIAHNRGKGARYTRGRLPVRLLWREGGLGRRAALRREAEIKKLRRGEKLLLVAAGGKSRLAALEPPPPA